MFHVGCQDNLEAIKGFNDALQQLTPYACTHPNKKSCLELGLAHLVDSGVRLDYRPAVMVAASVLVAGDKGQ